MLNARTASRRAVMLLLLTLPLLSGCAGSGGSVVAESDLDVCADAIYVPVSCRGEDYLFLLDTGASLCVFDRSMQDQLGSPIGRTYAMTHSGEEAIELFRAPPLTIGGRELESDEPVLCADLIRLHVGLDKHISGVLGMSFLEDYALQLDADGGKVRLLESPAPDTARYGEALRLGLEPYGCPELTVDVGDTTEWVTGLDTGCSFFGAMEYELCEDLLGNGILRGAGVTQMMTPHHSVTSNLVVLGTLRFGSFAHAGAVLSRGESSVLGLPFLLSYNMTLDFPERVAYLERRGYTAIEGYDNELGLAIYRRSGGLAVSAVASGGPSAVAGVLAGDVILAVEDHAVRGVSQACIEDVFRSGRADSLTLLLERDGRQVTAAVVLGRGSSADPKGVGSK